MKYSGINFKFMLLLLPKIIPGIRLKVTIANVRNSLSDLTRSAAASPAKRTKTFSLLKSLKSNVCFKRRCQNRSGFYWIKCLHCSFLVCIWKWCFSWLINFCFFLHFSFCFNTVYTKIFFGSFYSDPLATGSMRKTRRPNRVILS